MRNFAEKILWGVSIVSLGLIAALVNPTPTKAVCKIAEPPNAMQALDPNSIATACTEIKSPEDCEATKVCEKKEGVGGGGFYCDYNAFAKQFIHPQRCLSTLSYNECNSQKVGNVNVCAWDGPTPSAGAGDVAPKCGCTLTITGASCAVSTKKDFVIGTEGSAKEVFDTANWFQCPYKSALEGQFGTTKTKISESTCANLNTTGTKDGLQYTLTCSAQAGSDNVAGGDNDSAVAGTAPVSDTITSDYLKGRYPRPEGYTGPIPDCAFSGTCRSTSDLVILLINAAKFLFSIIGVVAFAAFVYGGFMMIFSFGNSEKVSQGKDAMVAAVVGLVIAFGAYMIINFILNALGVSPEFRGIID